MDTRTLLGALVFITAPVCLQATTSSVPLNYEYDANGNLISGDGKYYEYNDANRLVKIRHYDKTGPVIAEYFYDHTGQRVKKIEDGITTYYIGKHFEAQPDGDKLNNTSYYFANGERVAKKDSTDQLSYYHTNHLGSTSVMTDKDGKLVENTRYYPFGDIREGGKEKYSFTGKEKDRTSESYYFEARYYGSELKHFTQADIIELDTYSPQKLNRYSYVVNNPLILIDPSGHSSREAQKYLSDHFAPASKGELESFLKGKAIILPSKEALLYACSKGVLSPKLAGKLIAFTSLYTGPAIDTYDAIRINYNDMKNNPNRDIVEQFARFSMDMTVVSISGVGDLLAPGTGIAIRISYQTNREKIQQNILHNPVSDWAGNLIYNSGHNTLIGDFLGL